MATTCSLLLSQFYIELGRWQCGSLLATKENYSGNLQCLSKFTWEIHWIKTCFILKFMFKKGKETEFLSSWFHCLETVQASRFKNCNIKNEPGNFSKGTIPIIIQSRFKIKPELKNVCTWEIFGMPRKILFIHLQWRCLEVFY